MELSYSKAATARSCWMKYKWRYIDRLRPIVKPITLTLGTIMHDAFDMFYKGKEDEATFTYIVDEFNKAISEAGLPGQEDLRIAKYTALGMWKFNPIKSLSEFSEIHSEEEGKQPMMAGITYRYKLDGRLKKGNVWWLRELKTTSMNIRQFEGRMRTSGQATGYVWAANKRGYNIEGIMYDCIRKSLLRKGRFESCNDFGKRIMFDYKERPDHYYSRHYTYRNEVNLAQFERDMLVLANEMIERERINEFYRNPDQCWSFNSECPYLKICHTAKPDPLTVELYYTKGGDDDRNKDKEVGKGNGNTLLK